MTTTSITMCDGCGNRTFTVSAKIVGDTKIVHVNGFTIVKLEYDLCPKCWENIKAQLEGVNEDEERPQETDL